MKVVVRVALVLAVLGVVAAQGLALSPPWWTFYHTFMGTIGRDQTLHIPLMTEADDGSYQIDVYVEGEDAYEVGPALAGLVWGDHDFGGVVLRVRVWTPIGDAILPPVLDALYDPIQYLLEMANTGLRHNPLFVEAILGGRVNPFIPAFPDVMVILEPEVVEYWNDDLSDRYGYRHLVAQDAFAEVMNAEYFESAAALGFTTDPRRH